MITGIVVALPEELDTLTSRKISKGSICQLSDKFWVVYSGAGHENARITAESLVKVGANCLISWGCAAALNTGLKPGDLILATAVVDADGNEFDLDNKDWVNNIQSKLPNQIRSHSGKLAESKSIVATSHDKADIGKTTGAIALDMESIAIAKVAKLHGLPFLTIRTIADPLALDLPKAVSHALNAQGEVELSKLLLFLFLHPTELPGLIRLAMCFHKAKNTLRCIAKEMDALIF